MLLRALLQTSLVLWLAQQTLQGGVKPQNVAYGKALPARGIGIGVKPGVPAVTGALGALGSRYGTKAAMKTGIGRYPAGYPAAHLGVGGYRALGLGGRAGLKQGGYGAHGAYGASLGPGMGLGPGLANGFGLGLGQGGKRVYGAGLGTLPGYGPYAGIGYPGARPGASAADLGGPEVAGLGQAVQDLMRQKSIALGHLNGIKDRILGHETARRGFIRHPTVPELHTGIAVRNPDPAVQAPVLRPQTSPNEQLQVGDLAISQAQGGERIDPERQAVCPGAALVAGGGRRQLPVDKDIRSLGSDNTQGHSDYDLSLLQKKKSRKCGSPSDLPEVSDINRFELLGSETQHSQSSVPEPHLGGARKHPGRTNPPAQGERSYQLPLSQGQGVSSSAFSSVQRQGTGNYLSALTGRQNAKGPEAEDISRLKMRGTVTVEDGGHRYGPVIPSASGTQSMGIISAGEGHEAQGFIAGGQDAKHLSQAEHIKTKSKASSISGQTGRSTNAASYLGGAGNYLGASLGAGGYGAGLGQGAYLGGAAGKLGAAAALGQGGYPQGIAGKSNGYGDGVTGYLGATAGNGFGYGNGYGDGYGAELADVAENKARKSEALSTGGYAGQVQGAYGALGTGLESTGGKYGAGVAQAPYGNAPVIPAGLEGDGGYPYATQQLSLPAEGGKTTNKYGAPAGYGAQQPGYGAQLGVTQDALGEQTGKYGGGNPALGNGYKG